MAEVQLVPLESSDREQFIKDNQEAFNYGAMEEFGLRDAHFEDKADEQIISSKTIEASIDSGEAYRIVVDGNIVGGTVIKVTGSHGELELLFIKPEVHSKGIGYASWCAIEKLHPEVTVWETFTPYFETRNIHFYVNRCGFHIVEYLNKHHTGDFPADEFESDVPQFPAGMFRFKMLEHGLLDFGFLLEPIDIEKFDYLRLPAKEVWGVLFPAGHSLAQEKAITRQQLRDLPLVVTSRTALRGEIEEWLKYPVSDLDIVATMNLIDNAASLAERGIACVLCVEGAVDMFDPARFAFRPLKPELSMTSVLAWKKLSPYAGAAGKFLEYIKTYQNMTD